MKKHVFSLIRLYIKCVLCCVVLQACESTVDAAAPETTTLPANFVALRQRSCENLQGDYDVYVLKNGRTLAGQAFQCRLRAVDETAASILRELTTHHAAFLAQSLAIVGQKPSVKPSKDASQLQGASALMLTQSEKWLKLQVVEEIDANKPLVKDYWHAYVLGTSQALSAYCQAVIGTSSDDSADIVRLSMIVPLLGTIDDDWNEKSNETLSQWMKQPSDLQILEEFCLRIQRPRTAYQLACLASKSTVSGTKSNEYTTYLRSRADRLLRTGDYKPAIYCLQAALMIAATSGPASSWTEQAIYLAQVLSDTGDNRKAVNLIDDVLAKNPDAAEYGRVAVLRMKYLYKARQFAEAIKSEKRYNADTRCTDVMPQILYLTWVCSREAQDNLVSTESTWRQTFLERFPDHPLGAEIYFNTAIQALASGEYDQASRILRYVEYHYPDSPIIPKVKALESKLDIRATTAPATE